LYFSFRAHRPPRPFTFFLFCCFQTTIEASCTLFSPFPVFVHALPVLSFYVFVSFPVIRLLDPRFLSLCPACSLCGCFAGIGFPSISAAPERPWGENRWKRTCSSFFALFLGGVCGAHPFCRSPTVPRKIVVLFFVSTPGRLSLESNELPPTPFSPFSRSNPVTPK